MLTAAPPDSTAVIPAFSKAVLISTASSSSDVFFEMLIYLNAFSGATRSLALPEILGHVFFRKEIKFESKKLSQVFYGRISVVECEESRSAYHAAH